MFIDLSNYSVIVAGVFVKEYFVCKRGDAFVGEHILLDEFLLNNLDKNSKYYGAKLDPELIIYIPADEVNRLFKQINFFSMYNRKTDLSLSEEYIPESKL